MRIDIDERGARAAARLINNGARRASDARPVFRTRVYDHLLAAEEAVFSATGPATWEPLKAKTREAKKRPGRYPTHGGRARGGQPIMRASGRLHRTLTKKRQRGQKRVIGRREMTFGLKHNGPAYYGRFHQTGAGAQEVRPIIGAGPVTRHRIKRSIQRWIVRGRL